MVIDIKNGKPPNSSAFENPLPPLAKARRRGRLTFAEAGRACTPANTGPAYDWVAARYGTDVGSARAGRGGDPQGGPEPHRCRWPKALEPLRTALIEEMSRGAAAGLIDLNLSRHPKEDKTVSFPSAAFTLGDSPNYAAHLGANSKLPVTATGGHCLSDADLDVSSWAISKAPIAEQMAVPMTGLLGEFDKPDDQALARAVKFDLFLGFGTEARALMRAFPTEGAASKTWQSMAAMEDGLPDKAAAFRGMAACDSAAALWATLSARDLQSEAAVNGKAIVRAFSALPPHLRTLLGPRLVDRLLSIHDEVSARSVRDAAARQPDAQPAEVALVEAKLDVAKGDFAAAEAQLKPVATAPGPGSEKALAELVRATAEDLKPVAPEQIDALTAVVKERRSSPDAGRFETALALGHAAAGQFDAAFASLDRHPEIAGTLWKILSVLGSDSDLITRAVLQPGDRTPARRPAGGRTDRRQIACAGIHRVVRGLVGGRARSRSEAQGPACTGAGQGDARFDGRGRYGGSKPPLPSRPRA